MTDRRYGIFLRPDPQTCWNVTQVTFAIARQFGYVSAGAFPPHATLIGNLRTHAGHDELVAALDPVFAATSPFTVHNSGVTRTAKDTYEYNVNLSQDGVTVNAAFAAVASAVKDAVIPLALPHEDYLTTATEEYQFAGHLGLASHELLFDNSLCEEIGGFIEGLPIDPPPAWFTARWYSLFEFQADWSGHWWEHMSWRHLHSWHVTAAS